MISAVVLTKNEEKNIGRCIESLLWCNEIVVVDDFSTDGTTKIAQSLNLKTKNYNLKLKIFRRHLNGDFAAQRNYGLSKATGDWVLFVDADEIVTPALAREITNHQSLFTNRYSGFYIKRRDIMWGRELRYGETGNVKLLRLARKNAGVWKRRVHEYWDVKGETSTLNSPLLHYPHQTLTEFASHINFYSTLHAQQKLEHGEHSSIFKIILWPKVKFISNYFLRGGFMDGNRGFVHAMLMSFHSFLAWSKLWLMRQEKVST